MSEKSENPNARIAVAIIGAVAALLAALIAAIFGPVFMENRHHSATQTAEAGLIGDQVFEINFSTKGEGNCNDYDPELLGYAVDKKMYYIIPKSNGYISVCHKDDTLQPQGILQTTAFPEEKDANTYGYAVFFGWQGSGLNTTDGCGFGVKKNDSTTEAFFVQRIGGNWERTPTVLKDISLDTKPHAIRMELYQSGKAFGYLDGNYVAEHSFIDCATGPVGLMAYGPGDIRINFTSLKLFNLP
jgi:hypothetical protein